MSMVNVNQKAPDEKELKGKPPPCPTYSITPTRCRALVRYARPLWFVGVLIAYVSVHIWQIPQSSAFSGPGSPPSEFTGPSRVQTTLPALRGSLLNQYVQRPLWPLRTKFKFPPNADFSALNALRSDECRNYFKRKLPDWVVVRNQTLVADDFSAYPEGAPLDKPLVMKRMITFEDFVPRWPYIPPYPQGTSSMMIRTFHRRARLYVSETGAWRSSGYLGSAFIPIWKCGSSSLKFALQRVNLLIDLNNGRFGLPAFWQCYMRRESTQLLMGPPELRRKFGNLYFQRMPQDPKNSSRLMSMTDYYISRIWRDQKTSRKGYPKKKPLNSKFCHMLDSHSLTPTATSEMVAWTLVRHPLGRFISQLKDHGEYKLCNEVKGHEEYCPKEIQFVKESMRKFYDKGNVGNPHYKTQSYFLSATDEDGEPLHFDFIGQLRNFKHDVEMIADITKVKNWKILHTNQKSISAKKKAETLLMQDTAFMCQFCTVFGQDFVCTGFAVPEICKSPVCLPYYEKWGILPIFAAEPGSESGS